MHWKKSLIIIAAVLGGGEAGAAPCDTIAPGVDRIYMASGDTQEPLLKHLGRRLRDSTAKPLVIFYRNTGTCTLAPQVYNQAKFTQVLSYIPSTAEAPNWTPADPSITCDFPAGQYPVPDLGIGATFIESCGTLPTPPGGITIKQFPGPIQAYNFVVPNLSSQTALTAEEGYLVFGFGSQSEVDPWDNEQFMFIRTTTKSTLLTLMAAVNVPVNKAKGKQYDASSDVLNAVIGTGSTEKTIGLLGAEIFDANRDKLKTLAFKGFKQRYAYWPDSSPTAFDKANVRDGHYLPWSPTVYITTVDGQGVANKPNVKYFMDMVLGSPLSPKFEVNPLEVVIARGLIPQCAMKVTRPLEGAPLSLFDSPEPCHCYYDSRTATTACKQCADDNACGTGKCRHGYCEAK
jgi:hypothetical protein